MIGQVFLKSLSAAEKYFPKFQRFQGMEHLAWQTLQVETDSSLVAIIASFPSPSLSSFAQNAIIQAKPGEESSMTKVPQDFTNSPISFVRVHTCPRTHKFRWRFYNISNQFPWPLFSFSNIFPPSSVYFLLYGLEACRFWSQLNCVWSQRTQQSRWRHRNNIRVSAVLHLRNTRLVFIEELAEDLSLLLFTHKNLSLQGGGAFNLG